MRNLMILAAASLLWVGIAANHGTTRQARTLTSDMDNLEGEWLFRTDPANEGGKEGWQNPGLRDDGWRTLRAPGYWEEQGITDSHPGQPPKPASAGVRWTDYDGVAWYRLNVIVPAEWAGKPLMLHLGSVDDFDRTFFNGQLVGEVKEGTDRAVTVQREYAIASGLVRPGEQNVIAVRVTDGGGPGGIMGPGLFLLPREVVDKMQTLPQGNRRLSEQFADPPAGNRILKIIHGWPDETTAQDLLIRTLISQGFGGVVCNDSFDRYLESDDHWKEFTRAVGEAKKAGMSLWLYDEKGYPSGTAGGITLRGHPVWAAQGLLIADSESDGGKVELDAPPGDVRLAAAFPVTADAIDMDHRVDLKVDSASRKITWDAPTGHWHLMAITEGPLYEGTHATMSLGEHVPYINLLMAEPTKRFLEVTHGRYAAHLGDDLGKWFVSTFTDEPSLMSMFLRPMPYRPLPWSPGFADEFQKRRGYALAPILPALVANAGPKGERWRYDFWKTVGELVSENYFGQIQEWCRAHRTQSGGHLLMEESILEHVPLYGSYYECVRRLDAPSIDCLTSIPGEVPWFIARQVSSAAEVEGRITTMCETSDFGQVYRPTGDKRPVRNVTEAEIRGTVNRLMLGGITTITSYYTYNGLDSAALRRLNLHVGRCSTMLTGGHRVAGIALLYPIESIWPRFVPARSGANGSAAATAVESAYRSAIDSLYGAGRDFDIIDSRAIQESTVSGGALVHGKLRWRVVVLPDADTLPVAAWEKLAAFVRGGGVLIAAGALPTNSESEFPSPQVRRIARALFGSSAPPSVHASRAGGAGIYLPPGSEALLPDVVDSLLPRDVQVSGTASPIHATHRRIDGHEVYFLINDGGSSWRGAVGLDAAGPGEMWNPATGGMSPVAAPNGIQLSLEPYGAVLLRFERAIVRPLNRPAEGSLPGLALSKLPAVEPIIGKGEFVEGGFAADEATPAGGWLARGKLTKGQTDTFLMTSFRYPKGIDLSSANSLVLDTWVPPNQHAPTQLVVILHEKDGGEYFAESGRSLGAPGRQTTYVPLTRFQPAGWAHDPDGRLDLGNVDSFTVGWGGYYGTAGEVVTFWLGPVRLARRAR